MNFYSDAVVSGGTSFGRLPASRGFIGGSRLDPLLLDDNLGAEDYLWMGPLIRGYSVSQFTTLKRPLVGSNAATSFGNLSLTLGLPGLSRLVFIAPTEDSTAKRDYQEKLAALANNFPKIVQAGALSKYLETEQDPQIARQRARQELNETRQIIGNLLSHARVNSLRPLVIFDYGVLQSPAGLLNDWSVGGGARMWVRGGNTFDVLYAHSGGAVSGVRPWNLMVRYRVTVSDFWHFPYVRSNPGP